MFCVKITSFSFSLSPLWPKGLVYRYVTMPVFVSGDGKYTCQVWRRSVGKCTNLHQPHLFTHLALGVGFSIWHHASIFFRVMKNTCAKFGPDPSENSWFCIKPNPLSPFWPPDWFLDMKSRQYLFLEDGKYMCQVWSWSVEKCILCIKPTSFPHFGPRVFFFFSKWRHASIYSWATKNTCAKFGPDPSKKHDFFSTASQFSPNFGQKGWIFLMKPRLYFLPMNEKYMCQGWCR